MTDSGWGGPPSGPLQLVCARHPDRPTSLACTRCGRPACPQCLTPAAVGQHCVDCVAQGNKSIRGARTIAGAPLGSSRSGSAPTPYVTYTLIALNVLVFAFTAFQSRSILSNESPSTLFADWALIPNRVALLNEYVRLIGSGFLHFGPIHLLFNMFALYVIGRDIEMILGRARFTAIYFVSLIGGSASVMVLQGGFGATAGASGAIFGLLGAQAVILLRLGRSPMPVLIIIGINIVLSVSIPGISLWGHMGGLVAGTVASAGLLFAQNYLKSLGTPRLRGAVAIGLVALVAVAVIALKVQNLRSSFGV